MGTLYDLLGALPDDDAEGLRTAFRKAAKATHPDLNPDNPEAALRFRQLVRAHDILSDEQQRLVETARKFTRERLAAVRSFYQKLFHGPGVFADRLNDMRHQAGTDPAIAEILAFIDAGKHRELCQPAKHGNKS